MSHSLIAAGLVAAAAALAPISLPAQRVDGSRALLSHVDAPFPVAIPDAAPQHLDPIDGERALLGRSITQSDVASYPVAVDPVRSSKPLSGAYALLARR